MNVLLQRTVSRHGAFDNSIAHNSFKEHWVIRLTVNIGLIERVLYTCLLGFARITGPGFPCNFRTRRTKWVFCTRLTGETAWELCIITSYVPRMGTDFKLRRITRFKSSRSSTSSNIQHLTERSIVRFDWTFDRAFHLSLTVWFPNISRFFPLTR